jgi:hypothetical protein
MMIRYLSSKEPFCTIYLISLTPNLSILRTYHRVFHLIRMTMTYNRNNNDVINKQYKIKIHRFLEFLEIFLYSQVNNVFHVHTA